MPVEGNPLCEDCDGKGHPTEWLSACCGAPPGFGSDVAEDNQAGICAQCRDHAGFEKVDSEDDCPRCLGTGVQP